MVTAPLFETSLWRYWHRRSMRLLRVPNTFNQGEKS